MVWFFGLVAAGISFLFASLLVADWNTSPETFSEAESENSESLPGLAVPESVTTGSLESEPNQRGSSLFPGLALEAANVFKQQVEPVVPDMAISIHLDPGLPQSARDGRREEIDYALPYLQRLVDRPLAFDLIALASPEWGIDKAAEVLSPALGAVVGDGIVESEIGRVDGCQSGSIGGFAQLLGDEIAVVVEGTQACDNSKTNVAHELMHVAQFASGPLCSETPLWFDEGQAEFFAIQLAIENGQSIAAEMRETTVIYLENSVFVSLDAISAGSSPLDPYVYGFFAIEYLTAEHGFNATMEVLRAMRDSETCRGREHDTELFEAVFQTTFGMTVAELSTELVAYINWLGGHADQPLSDASSARSMLDTLRIADEFRSGYQRDLFGASWLDLDGDGCDTRSEVLISQSVEPASTSGMCTVRSGLWFSPFDGEWVDDPSNLDIDHLVPLAEAWDSGASSWTEESLQSFANDNQTPYALIAVTSSSNRSKGDRDPSDWMPSQESFHCEYAALWVSVKVSWSLAVDPREYDSLAATLDRCRGQEVNALLGSDPLGTLTTSAATGIPVDPTNLGSSCHQAYSPCLEIVGDLNCGDIALSSKPVTVLDPNFDPYRLDRDGDGWGCES